MKMAILTMLLLMALSAKAGQEVVTILKSTVPYYSISNATLEEAVAIINKHVAARFPTSSAPFVHVFTNAPRTMQRLTMRAENVTVGGILSCLAHNMRATLTVGVMCLEMTEDRDEQETWDIAMSIGYINPIAQRELGLTMSSHQTDVQSAFQRLGIRITDESSIIPLADLGLTPKTTNELEVMVTLAPKASEKMHSVLLLLNDGYKITQGASQSSAGNVLKAAAEK